MTTTTRYLEKKVNNMAQGMYRRDGSMKSNQGFLGQVVRDDGGVMTEFSTNVEDINKRFGDSPFSYEDERGVRVVDFPTLVPTLTAKEVETLRTLPEGKKPPKSILNKAANHAIKRLEQGQSPFYQDAKPLIK